MLDSIKSFQLRNALVEVGHRFRRERSATPGGDQHHILGRVLRRHKLAHPHAVAGAFQQERPERVGGHLRVALGKEPVPQEIAQRLGGKGVVDLGPRLLVAARRGENDVRPGANPGKEGVVGGGVAGVQRHQNIQGGERVIRNRAAHKAQPRKAALRRHAVAEARQILPSFHARHLRGRLLHALKIVVGGEGEIPFARAHVGHHQWAVQPDERALVEGRGEQIDKAFNLPELVAHPLAHLAARVGDFQLLQVARPGFHPSNPVAIVFQCRRRPHRLDDPQAVLLPQLKLCLLRLGEEVGAQKLGSQARFHQGKRLRKRVILGFIAGEEPAHHGQARLAPDGHGPDEQLAQGARRLGRMAQRQLDQRAVVQAGPQPREKLGECIVHRVKRHPRL